MKISVNFLIFSVLFIFIFSACQKDSAFSEPVDNEPIIEFPLVDLALQSYFQRFEMEGRARGFEVDLNTANISAVIEEIQENNVAGSCTYGTFTPGSIVIDLNFWNNSSGFAKEMVVFHELGHCFLHRGHEEGAFGNGVCRSIMRSGVEGCFDNYRSETRDYYLDELFENVEN